jgi:hypothetical protein
MGDYSLVTRDKVLGAEWNKINDHTIVAHHSATICSHVIAVIWDSETNIDFTNPKGLEETLISRRSQICYHMLSGRREMDLITQCPIDPPEFMELALEYVNRLVAEHINKYLEWETIN